MRQLSGRFLSAVVLAGACLLVTAGDLEPPGPPAPTPKPLSEIEPREPIGSLPVTILSAFAPPELPEGAVTETRS